MPNLLQFDLYQYLGLFLVFARVTGVMITAPVLSDATIPMQVKIGFSFVLSLVFFPLVGRGAVPGDANVWRLLVLVLGEVGVGLLIGFAAQLLFAGISLAGEIIGFQMGVSLSQVFDPAFNTQESLLARIETLLALMLFVSVDGHHLFIEALAKSYQLAPVGAIALGKPALGFYTMLAGQMFIIGLQVGAPLIIALLAANFSMGLMGRAVPQMNIFVVGFPFTIALGLLLLTMTMPFFAEAVAHVIHMLEQVLMQGMQVLR